MQKKKNRSIQLGNLVRDAMTGFEGIAAAHILMLNGNVQFAVQPKCKKDKTEPPTAYNLDSHLLQFVEDGVAHRVTPALETSIKVGDKAMDKITRMVGIVTEKTTFINGCIYFTLLPEVDKDGTPNKGIFISQDRLEVIEANAFKPTPYKGVKKTDTDAGALAKPPGGPMTRANSIRD